MLLDPHWRGAEGAGEIADAVDVLGVRTIARRFEGGRGRGRLQVEAALVACIVRPDQRGGGARLLEAFGHNEGDRLMIMGNVRPAEEMGDVHHAERQRLGMIEGG